MILLFLILILISLYLAFSHIGFLLKNSLSCIKHSTSAREEWSRFSLKQNFPVLQLLNALPLVESQTGPKCDSLSYVILPGDIDRTSRHGHKMSVSLFQNVYQHPRIIDDNSTRDTRSSDPRYSL